MAFFGGFGPRYGYGGYGYGHPYGFFNPYMDFYDPYLFPVLTISRVGWLGFSPWMSDYAGWMTDRHWIIWQTFQDRLDTMSTSATAQQRSELLLRLIREENPRMSEKKMKQLAARMLEMGKEMIKDGHKDGDKQSRFEDVSEEYEKVTTTTTTTTQNNQQAMVPSNGVTNEDRYEAANHFLDSLGKNGHQMSQQDAAKYANEIRSGKSDDLVQFLLRDKREELTRMVTESRQKQIEYQPPPPQQVYTPPPVQQPQQPMYSPQPQQQMVMTPPAATPQYDGNHYAQTTTSTTTTTTTSTSAYNATPGGQVVSPGGQYATPMQSPPVQQQYQQPMQHQLPSPQAPLQIANGPYDPNTVANFNQAGPGYGAQTPRAPQQQYGQAPMQQPQQPQYAGMPPPQQGYPQSPPPQQMQQQQLEYNPHSPQQQHLQEQMGNQSMSPAVNAPKEKKRDSKKGKDPKKEKDSKRDKGKAKEVVPPPTMRQVEQAAAAAAAAAPVASSSKEVVRTSKKDKDGKKDKDKDKGEKKKSKSGMSLWGT